MTSACDLLPVAEGGRGGEVTGVAEQLGLDGLDSELLREAATLWPGWATEDDRLQAVDGLEELRPWLRVAEPGVADRVLQALAIHEDSTARSPAAERSSCVSSRPTRTTILAFPEGGFTGSREAETVPCR